MVLLLSVGLLPVGVVPAATASAAAPAAVAAPAAPTAEEPGEPSAEAVALARAAETGRPVEVDEAATETQTVVANPSGTLTLSVSQEPVRVPDASGELVDVDTSLEPTGGDLATVATPADITVSGDGAGTLATVSDPDGAVSVGLGFEGALADPVVQGDTATYARDANTAVRVSTSDDGFAAHVLLEESPVLVGEEGPVYRFPLRVEGARPRLVGGTLEFVDGAGAVVASSSMLRMWDARVDGFGDPANVVPVDATLVDQAGETVLELRPDPEWLADPARVYPVTVDPDVTLDPGVDTYITNEYPASGFNTDWSLRVGSPDGTYRYQSFLNFPLDSQVGETITDAKVSLWQYAAGNCNPREIVARMATSDWDGSAPGVRRSWNGRGGRTSEGSRFTTDASFNAAGPGSPSCGGGTRQEIDVTGQVSTWAGMVDPRLGIYLTTPFAERTNPNFEKRFCSSDTNPANTGKCRDAGKAPELKITYTPKIGDQSWYSTTDHRLGERDMLKVNHESGNTHLAANDVQVTSVGMDLMVGRRYNSRATTKGQFGKKWTLSGGPDVWLEKLDEWRYVYHSPDGAELGPFLRKADDPSNGDYTTFFSPAGGIGARLFDNGAGQFTLRFNSSQQRYVFTAKGGNGHLYQTEQKDRSGNTTTFNYQAGTTLLSSVSDTAGRTYQIGYTAAGLIDEITEANGPTTRTWSYGYTGEQLTSYTDPEGDTTTYQWGPGNNLGQGPGPEGEVIEQITDPVNDSTLAPTASLVTDEGETTRVGYAGATGAENAGYAFTYQDAPLVSQCSAGVDRSATVISDEPTMGEVYYCFRDRLDGDLNTDANNKTTTVIDTKGDTRKTSFSPDNQPETLENDAGTTVNTYGDPAGELGDQLQKTTDPVDSGSTGAGAATSYTYHTPSAVQGDDWLPSSMVDGNGDCTAYAYDNQGRLTDTWIGRDPGGNGRCDADGGGSGGQRYQASYNSDGTIAWMQDPNNNTTLRTVYAYWKSTDTGFVPGTRGQIRTVTRPGGSCAAGAGRSLCTSFSYDGLARTLQQSDGRGEVTRYSYDAMDRTTETLANGATSCQLASGNCIRYDYDKVGNLVQREDQQGTTSFDFDRLNRQTRQATPDGAVVTYAYNRDSRTTKLEQTLPRNTGGTVSDEVTYTWDNTGQLNAVTDAAGTIQVGYDKNQRLDSTVFPTSPQLTRIDRTYTNSGRPKKVTTRSGTSTNDQMTDYTYGYRNENNTDTDQLQTLKVTNSPSTITYDADFDYNTRGQLTSETRTGGGGPSFSYTYDPAGNIATATKAGTTTHFGYDRANQLCWTGASDGTSPVAACPATAPGSSQVVDRDAAGNSEGDPDHPISYNPRNQANDIDGQPQGYHDQGNDLRIKAGDTALVNTQTGITARTTQVGTPSAETTFFTRMPDGRLLSMRGPAGTFYYVTDHQKSVLGLINSVGQRAGTYRYDPYGASTLVEGTAAEQANPFRWIGGYQNNTDQPGGYYKLGARYYNPATGAFTQPDPVPGTMREPLRTNPYTYAGGNPINNTDPNGLYWGQDTVEAVVGWDGWGDMGRGFAELGGSLASCASAGVGATRLTMGAAAAASIVAPGVGGVIVQNYSFLAGCVSGIVTYSQGSDNVLQHIP